MSPHREHDRLSEEKLYGCCGRVSDLAKLCQLSPSITRSFSLLSLHKLYTTSILWVLTECIFELKNNVFHPPVSRNSPMILMVWQIVKASDQIMIAIFKKEQFKKKIMKTLILIY